MAFSLVSTSQGVPEPISCLFHQFQDAKLEQPSSATDSIPHPTGSLTPGLRVVMEATVTVLGKVVQQKQPHSPTGRAGISATRRT